MMYLMARIGHELTIIDTNALTRHDERDKTLFSMQLCERSHSARFPHTTRLSLQVESHIFVTARLLTLFSGLITEQDECFRLDSMTTHHRDSYLVFSKRIVSTSL
ncbi:uncharacterized protein Nmag_0366 [Natrialba magadii ATCC 43099]|uniref:Uncharacterized protein n=1 Tax=Natrialba magadii (strain ATCC 43099 / DSM 3394 / CCM 3739 / CIP 104546 / IAM 13178 / JCM 8861 / NBRC 102185 / NCIMB 2190 / MS3) TaxID=547559 RepID=D3SXD6_NATMM|nr:uncharacterized protein Nmag_0366 [Natrialba magadii ATCC 43099]